MLDSFDTLKEAEAYLEQQVSEGYDRKRIIIFDDKDFPDLGKRYSVNYD